MKPIAVVFLLLSSNLFGQDTLNSIQFEMNNCIPLYSNSSLQIIRNKEELDSRVRKDASSERCLKSLEDLDLVNSSLLGININSGDCRIPIGLSFDLVKMEEDKKYLLHISYIEPLTPCRALSSYKLWIKVPEIPEQYKVECTITALPHKE